MTLMSSRSGVAVVSRHLKRLTLLSSNYASATNSVSGTPTLGSIFSSKPGAFPASQDLGAQPLLLGGVRYKFSKKPNFRESRKQYKDEKDAIHCHGFSYYPRFPNHKDPPIEPTKLLMVKRIRSLYGCPRWEKRLVLDLGLGDRRDVAVVKNTPTQNADLYKIKHLIEIKPITMPYGMPDSPENGFLKENGELISYNPLKLHGEDTTMDSAVEKWKEHTTKSIGGKTLKNRLHLQWYSRYDVI